MTDRDPSKGSRAIVTDHVDSGAPPVQAAPSVIPKPRTSATSSRPIVSRKARANQAEAPNLEADLTAQQPSGALAGMIGSSNALPPPPNPGLRVGGVIQTPKLISSVPPVYPSAAPQGMLDGDVVIHAVIDKNGNVTDAKAVSGPSMLQSAAVTAVRRWKYSPSLLDGQPVASDVTVTLKFHH